MSSLLSTAVQAIAETDATSRPSPRTRGNSSKPSICGIALVFLTPNRYCEVDSELMNFAWKQFGRFTSGWAKVQAVCDFVHDHIRFDYQHAQSHRTALDAFREKVGVCRDFTHLAMTLCRCLNLPARYVTGYLEDIGVPPLPEPMDFSAWFEVYLDGQWYSFDARHNQRRIGRISRLRNRMHFCQKRFSSSATTIAPIEESGSESAFVSRSPDTGFAAHISE